MAFHFLVVPLHCALVSQLGQQRIQAFELRRLVDMHRLQDLCCAAQHELGLPYLHSLERILDLRRMDAEGLVDQLHYPFSFVPLVRSELVEALYVLGLILCLAARPLACWFSLGILVVACLLGAGLLEQWRRRQRMHAFDHLYLPQRLEGSNRQRFRLILIVFPSIIAALIKHRVVIRWVVSFLFA